MAYAQKTKQYLVTKYNSVDANYGPWNSIQEFLDFRSQTIGTTQKLGTTIAIKPAVATDPLVEYWNPVDANTFIKKGGSDIALDTTVPETPADGHVYASALSKTELAGKVNTSDIDTVVPETPVDTKVPSTKVVSDNFQLKLTAGDNISISSNVISVDSSKLIELVATDEESTVYHLKCFKIEQV